MQNISLPLARDVRFAKRSLQCLRIAAGLSLFAVTEAQAQTIDTYQFTASKGTFTPLAGGTLVTSIQADDATSASLPIGFAFPFEGVKYTTFQASSNGLLGFSGRMPNYINMDMPSLLTSQLPAIAPFISDLAGQYGEAQASYLTTGTAPNRVLTMEWLHWGYCCGKVTANVLSFQVKLYETSGRIEMVYRREAGGYSKSASAIGLKGLSGEYLSLSSSGASPTASSTVSTGSLPEPATDQVYTFLPGNVWTGAISTEWDVAGNWKLDLVPTSTTTAIIPATANQPRVTGAQTCARLLMKPGAVLTLASSTAAATVLTTTGSVNLPDRSTLVQQAGTKLHIGDNLFNNGATFALDPTSEIGFGGGAGTSHTLSGAGTTPFQNLTLGEQSDREVLRIQAPATVQHVLTLDQTATMDVTPSGRLTLLSNATGTAQLMKDAGSAVTGTVRVQRYIMPTLNAGAGYRHYSAPVALSTTDSLTTAGFAPTLNAAYNTSPTPSLLTPFPTVFGYDESRVGTITSNYGPFDQGYFSPNAGSALEMGRGYTVNIAASETMVFTGPLANSDVTVANLTRGAHNQSGWQLVGNPYASVLDMAVVTAASTGLDAAVYVFQSDGQYTGSHQPYVNGVGPARYVTSSQGFFVRTTSAATPGVLKFTNAARSLVTTPTFQRTAPDTRPLVQLNLLSPNTQQRDAAYVYFQNGASTGFDAGFDAYKLPARRYPYLAVTTAAEPLAVSGLPLPGTTDVVVPLTVAVATTGTYTLEAASLVNLPAGKTAYLRDAQTGALVDLAQRPAYSFTLNSAFTGPRFSLLITGGRPLATLPAALTEQVAVYPNPARGQVLVELPASLRQQATDLSLVNSLGQTVKTLRLSATASAEARVLPLAGVATGIYSVQLATGQGLVTKRLVVE